MRGDFARSSGEADSVHVFVSPHARGELHVCLVADGGDALDGRRHDESLPTVAITQRRLAGGALTRPLVDSDFWSHNGAPQR